MFSFGQSTARLCEGVTRREWLRVAIEYFVLDDDANSDIKELSGMNDDAMVIATILEYCGFHQLSKPIRDYLA